MNRRTFLGTAATAAAVATWPDLLRRAFADVSIEPAPGGEKAASAALAEGLRRAREAGRPALVFVIPADAAQIYERGHLFGEYLNVANDKQLAPLGLADLFCARMDALAAVGVRPPGGREPLIVVVDPAGAARALAAEVPSWRGEGRMRPRDDEDEVIERRIAAVAALVRRGLDPDDRIAPPSIAALAGEVKRRYRQKPPPGSHWAHGGGCGTTIEDDHDDESMVSCGMGYVPAKSVRFLYLFAKTPGEERREHRRKQGRGTTL